MFETSTTTENLDKALAKAQSTIEEAELNCKNPFFSSTYADLTSVWRACRKALTENGISVTQWPIHSDDHRLHLVTRVALAGEWFKATMSCPVAKQDPQGYSSATTYLKRVALCAAVGVVGDSDDDGNTASTKPATKPTATKDLGFHQVTEPKEFTEARRQREQSTSEAERLLGLDTASPANGTHAVTKIIAKVERQIKNFAPGADNAPMPDEVPDWVTDAAAREPTLDSPMDYKIQFGKHVGKTIRQVGIKVVDDYVGYLVNKAGETGLSAGLQKLKDAVDAAKRG